MFDSNCPPMPDGAQLPLVFVNDKIVINGGKISVPLLRQNIEKILDKEKVYIGVKADDGL
ncbi:MAG: hypothetical protein ACPL6F_01320 [Anaerolineales bacterium]